MWWSSRRDYNCKSILLRVKITLLREGSISRGRKGAIYGYQVLPWLPGVTQYWELYTHQSSVNTCQIFALHFGGGAGVHYTTDQTQQGLQLNEERGSQMKKKAKGVQKYRCYHGYQVLPWPGYQVLPWLPGVTQYWELYTHQSSVNTCQIFALHFGGGAGVHYTTDQTQQGLQLNEGRGSQMKKERGYRSTGVTMVIKCYHGYQMLCTMY